MMQAVSQNNLLILKFADKNSKFYVRPDKITGYTGARFSFGKDKEDRPYRKYDVYPVVNPEGEDSMIILAGDRSGIVKLTVEDGQQIYVSLNSLVAFSSALKIADSNRHFYSRLSEDKLLLLSGPGDVYVENNTSVLMRMGISEGQENSFSADRIVAFESSLFFEISKISTEKNSISFDGAGVIFFRN